MIKRLKWNVLYGGGDGADSDGCLSSSSEEGEDKNDPGNLKKQAEANRLLQELVEKDPLLAETLHQKLQAATYDGNSSDSDAMSLSSDASGEDGGSQDPNRENGTEKGEAAEGAGEDNLVEEDEDADVEYAEWRECNICPGKRFLNDAEVESHLSSKRHRRAEAKYQKKMSLPKSGPGSEPNGVPSERNSKKLRDFDGEEREMMNNERPDAEDPNERAKGHTAENSEDEKQKKARRKAAAKKKLKALKRKKWEKKAKEGEGDAVDRPSVGGIAKRRKPSNAPPGTSSKAGASKSTEAGQIEKAKVKTVSKVPKRTEQVST
ncbi:unnamed protein product [Chondrus crispus]|uniref:Uncharacterized protein n=1 Tax=Chondrus crispus TaxID=2769 RepID=R7Q4T9_CHOCR|nr:unnamed protein product [Chondrus crispus]CDF32883.1 unnamed protein product [Chondrus crispus]|eukprot:XP_005712684.1 unnamed protein product [Chondrus crispus]